MLTLDCLHAITKYWKHKYVLFILGALLCQVSFFWSKLRMIIPRNFQYLIFFAYPLQKFILGGRLIFGPDARSLIVTLLLIIVPVIIFCVFVVRHLRHEFSPDNAGYAILVVAIIFTIYVSLLNPSVFDDIVLVIGIL
jgi:hypothetical protein